MASYGYQGSADLSDKVWRMGARGWMFLLAIIALAGMGVAMLYSVGGDPSHFTSNTPWHLRGDWDPWASRHAIRFAIALGALIALAFLPLRLWYEMAYPAFYASLALLIGVELFGATSMGATRWLQLGPIRVQPSEFMRLAIVMGLARYYHDLGQNSVSQPAAHLPAIIMILAPVGLIARQPDLGTALLCAATGGVMVLMTGVPWRQIIAAGALGAVGLVLVFAYGLQPYQRARIMTFLDPSNDPMGSGYHILQSKIAIGSGGLDGKGFGRGTQTQLDFLPEKHTDFIFTAIGEELGFFGGVTVLALVATILALGVSFALSAREPFARLAAIGASATFAFYVIINTAMVMGLVPVVGVPLPLVSYGGTVMFSVMAAFGLVLNTHLNRDGELPRPRGR